MPECAHGSVGLAGPAAGRREALCLPIVLGSDACAIAQLWQLIGEPAGRACKECFRRMKKGRAARKARSKKLISVQSRRVGGK